MTDSPSPGPTQFCTKCCAQLKPDASFCTVCGAADPNYKPGVKTGDESNTALWIVMMASAALLAAAVVVLPRRKRTR